MAVDWNVPDRYEIVRRIGGGRYSEVSTRVAAGVVVARRSAATIATAFVFAGLRGHRLVKRRVMRHQSAEASREEEDKARDQDPAQSRRGPERHPPYGHRP